MVKPIQKYTIIIAHHRFVSTTEVQADRLIQSFYHLAHGGSKILYWQRQDKIAHRLFNKYKGFSRIFNFHCKHILSLYVLWNCLSTSMCSGFPNSFFNTQILLFEDNIIICQCLIMIVKQIGNALCCVLYYFAITYNTNVCLFHIINWLWIGYLIACYKYAVKRWWLLNLATLNQAL